MLPQQRLQLLGRHLADAQGLRMEFSLELAGSRLLTRPAPLFWLGDTGCNNQAAFVRLQQLLRELECPDSLLECHRNNTARSLYQGVGVDLASAHTQACLFLHCRDEAGEQQLGYTWNGQSVQRTEYRTGQLADANNRAWLLCQVHADYRPLLAALLREARLVRRGGYWVQHKQGQDTEIYLTYPWHPRLESFAPRINAYLPTALPVEWQHYRATPIRHIGLSCNRHSAPALTFYVTAPYAGPWPRNLDELEQNVICSATAWREELARRVGE